ncbi:isocitrate/isopropylmalate dehydrogenase family protein [Candidatus Pantoea multigeneris]|uniref:Isocitrate/isopropylmalate dehydrogenase family protein n=1 Tax=Candidatus Pantoea multigeneris TaxID=2608357 RepID=A0ABX0R4T5_9GAMM|nr:isocitrate/isopropylmalate family dehydrogenase [Pantoea multigeneris]NIF20415.1 isocitrate/isopropylmalate dehydrogenase family protein [Pantoea multigeneris]
MNQPLTKNICVLPGDGVGAEVTEYTLPVIKALNIPLNLEFARIGWECWKEEGNSVPLATWEAIKRNDTTLLGAITSKPLREAEAALPATLRGTGHKFVSPVIQLRQNLDLFANVRPVTDILGNHRFRFTVIRENTEGLYAGLDFGSIPDEIEPLLQRREAEGAGWQRHGQQDAAISIRLQTRAGLVRLFRFAFTYAQQHSYSVVTFADKPNVLRYSSAFARDILDEVAAEFPHIAYNVENIDAIALWMVRRPEKFGVIVAENMFGDILSDLGAGIMGGLGFAPSANIGHHNAYFEPVHGSAPAYAGKDKANPSAMFLTLSLLLDHLGLNDAALAITQAVEKVARSEIRTYDLKGTYGTRAVAEEIIQSAQYYFDSNRRGVA